MQGIDAIIVTIEVSVGPGFNMTLVGLPDTAVRESHQRIMSAMRENGYEFPRRGVVINMSPADVRKEGASYDLPLAVGVMAATAMIPADDVGNFMIMGELSLDGTLLPIPGVLPMAIKAREMGFKGFIVPESNATEAAVVNNLDVYGMGNLREVIEFFRCGNRPSPVVVDTRAEFAAAALNFDCDFSEVKGQEMVKRAFEVACAGGHNILLVGPPGAGKSMMAKRLPTILPPLSLSEALETTKIHSVAGKLPRGSRLMTNRPFRAPHHTISPTALVGGGTTPRPGEISLAHNGVLFLDEFPEFSRPVLEVMRQPLEDRHISIARVKYTIDYPAGFMLVASMNPCPCGYYNHPTKECTCPPWAVQRYMSRISGPLLDRIDIQCEIFPVPFDELSSLKTGESSEEIRHRVEAARAIQAARYANEKGIHCNAQMNSRLMAAYATPDSEGMRILRDAMTMLDMSARAYDRILKVARTIADLAGEKTVGAPHIREAVSYRTLDRSSYGRTF